MTGGLRIGHGVVIDDDEIQLRFVRSGGPGGQKVNTSSTKVELRFDLSATTALRDDQRARALERLRPRLTDDGVLVLHASEHRTQSANRRAVLARLRTILADAIAPPPPARRATRPTRGAIERRLAGKRRRGEIKRTRQTPEV